MSRVAEGKIDGLLLRCVATSWLKPRPLTPLMSVRLRLPIFSSFGPRPTTNRLWRAASSPGAPY